MAHGHKRHGTTTVPAALNLLTGKVSARNMDRPRLQEFLHVLIRIARDTPAGKAIRRGPGQLPQPQARPCPGLACLPPVPDLPFHPDIKVPARAARGNDRPLRVGQDHADQGCRALGNLVSVSSQFGSPRPSADPGSPTRSGRIRRRSRILLQAPPAPFRRSPGSSGPMTTATPRSGRRRPTRSAPRGYGQSPGHT